MAKLKQLTSKRLERAYEFAEKAHEGQLRKDGSPYVTHPLAVLGILQDLHVDEDTLVAALLHDVPEDTSFTLQDIEKRFGKKVRFLVEGITKLSKVHYRNNMEERQVESLKKLFIHCAEDPRIILIKLADRLHNMSTLEAIPEEVKRLRIARETMEIYVPIANLLGIWEIKSQLEDLCFKHLYVREFQMIEKLMSESYLKNEEILKKTIRHISQLLKRNKIDALQIEGRKKSHYSIYTKMVHRGKSFQEIYDLVGLRIVLNTVGQCYQTLGILHQSYTPKPHRLKDYIAIPKPNGYQSIHTTIFGVDGMPTEIQIRTREMHLEAEYGVAAHYFYNKSKSKHSVVAKIQDQSRWVQKILDIQKEMDGNDKYLEQLKLDIFEDRIFVFTPKGDVVDLPKGAIGLDFAYNIHSDIGNRAVSALVNGHPASLSTELKTGDVIEIVTSEEVQIPKLEWLAKVQTNNARSMIRVNLRKLDNVRRIQEAERVFSHKMKLLGGEKTLIADKAKEQLASLFNHDSWKSLLMSIGNGQVDIRDVIRLLNNQESLIGKMEDAENIHVYDSLSKKLGRVSPEKFYRIQLLIEAKNRVGLLRDVASIFADLDINIVRTRSEHTESGLVSRLNFILEIRDIDHYDQLVSKLTETEGVIRVTRIQNEATTNQKI